MNKRMLLPIFVIAALLLGACNFNLNLNLQQGSGHVVTETRNVTGFDRVNLSGIGDLTLTQGDNEGLQIEAEDNVIPHIKTSVSGGTLEIGFDNKAIIPTKQVKFMLTMKNIHALETNGVSNLHSDKVDTDRLELSISGTGNINIQNLTADSLTVNVSGAGNLTTLGKVSDQKVNLSGAGNYNAEDLQSKTAEITISGLGRVTAWVTDQLNVTISGTGGVDYYGSPQISQQISGVGQLKHLGNK